MLELKNISSFHADYMKNDEPIHHKLSALWARSIPRTWFANEILVGMDPKRTPCIYFTTLLYSKEGTWVKRYISRDQADFICKKIKAWGRYHFRPHFMNLIGFDLMTCRRVKIVLNHCAGQPHLEITKNDMMTTNIFSNKIAFFSTPAE